MKNMLSLMTLMISTVLFGTLVVESQFDVADAAKATGTKNQPFGKNAPTQICGDRLCSLNPAMSSNTQPMTPSDANLESILKQMDAIHKKHQSQLKEKWFTLSGDEKVQFSKKIREMLKKMESMNMVEHMDEMMKGDHTKKATVR